MRELLFCTTCRHSIAEKTGSDGRTGGETLIAEVEQVLREYGRSDVKVARQSCLWSCTRHCNVWFRDSDRFSYLAGGFAPTPESAKAIVDWFLLHERSADGQVPFRQWPDGVRGHFIARLPPEASR